jgi:hypothetical protein
MRYRIPIALLGALAIVAGVSGAGMARPAAPWVIRFPGSTQRYPGIPASNAGYIVSGGPTFESCGLSTTNDCDSIRVDFDAGRANGHKTTIVLTWEPTQQAGNDLDFILWNEAARAECNPDPDNAQQIRYCGSEGRSIGADFPEKMVMYDLPKGSYVLQIWSKSGTNRNYTLSANIELIDISFARRTPSPRPTFPVFRFATPKPTPEPTVAPLPTPTPELVRTPGPDGPNSQMELPFVAAGKQAVPLGKGGGWVGKLVFGLLAAAVLGGGGYMVAGRIRRERF